MILSAPADAHQSVGALKSGYLVSSINSLKLLQVFCEILYVLNNCWKFFEWVWVGVLSYHDIDISSEQPESSDGTRFNFFSLERDNQNKVIDLYCYSKVMKDSCTVVC